MAEGRMLKKVICESSRVAALKSDTYRLLYTWLIPNLDVEGRISADIRILKSRIAPILDHISHTIIKNSLIDMEQNDLISLYEVDGKPYLELKRFHKHQSLREGRERPSDIPPISVGTPSALRRPSVDTAQQEKLREEKLREVNARARELPVDNSLPEPLPEDTPPETTLSKKEGEKPLSKNTHGERWTVDQGDELEKLMKEIRDRYRDQYHQQCYVWVQTHYGRANPDAALYCLRRLIQERLAGKQIPAPGRWLESVMAVENAKHEARESEQEHQDRKAEENRDIAKLISGIGILPKGA